VLRRQMHRPFRKPLIIFSPKSLLRHKLAVSKLEEMGPKTTFHRVLWDDKQPAPDDKIKKVILCTGKVYFDLFEEREKQGIKDTVILRLEQLYPFPFNALTKEISRYKNAQAVIWCQEEPKNLGYWQFVEWRIEEVLASAKLKPSRPRYVGRPESAATATGSYKRHNAEQAKLVNEALSD
jgi:2-oxoglutarate dehydrogenase E1 component